MYRALLGMGVVIGALGVAAAFLIPRSFEYIASSPQPALLTEALAPTEESSTDRENEIRLLFIGDVMLGRGVEHLMMQEGGTYPFLEMLGYLRAPDRTIGNFEGIVPREHIPTPSMTFQFSIREDFLSVVADSGFDVLSLANNHAFDYGEEALSHTRTLCKGLDLLCGGSPHTIDGYTGAVETIDGTAVGILFLNDVWGSLNRDALRPYLDSLVDQSDIQIAYIHWGEEYELVHNDSQESLARLLIDGGVDAVIGHHPHVVQDIELYQGKPILYSLGNFIFDQYFNDAVQEGLAVEMSIASDSVTYTLIPITSRGTESQPRSMTAEDSQALIRRILDTPLEASVLRDKNSITVTRE